MAQVKVAFKNALDKRAVYKPVEKDTLASAAIEYARLYCEDIEVYNAVMKQRVYIKLNRQVIDVDDWIGTPLRDGDRILIQPVLEGDFFNSGFLGVVLGALLIVAAAYTGGATLSLFGIAFNQSLFLMGSAMILGGLASVLMQPDLPTISDVGGLGGKGSTTYSWQGIKTQANPQTPLPIIYGKHLVGGNLINIFTERKGADDYLYMLLALGEGEIAGICTEENTASVCTTTDPGSASYKHPYITLDDQPFKNYVDVEWWYRKGTNLPDATKDQYDPTVQNIIPYFSGSRMQIDDGSPITKAGVIYTTTKEVDLARVQLRFPALFNAAGGSVSNTSVTYAIDFKKNGDATWLQVTTDRYDPVLTPQLRSTGVMTPSRNLSIVYNSDAGRLQAGGEYVLTNVKPDSYWIEVTDTVESVRTTYVDTNYGTINGEMTVKCTIILKNLTTNEITTTTFKKIYSGVIERYYTADGYQLIENFVKSGPPRLEGNRITVGVYDITFVSGLTKGDTFILSSTLSNQYWRTITDKSKTGLWDTVDLNFHELTGGEGRQIYDIRVKRDTEISTDFNISDQAILNSVVEIVNGDFIYPNTALLGLRIKATDQLSGSPPNVNVLVKGLKVNVPDHSGTEPFNDLFWSDTNNRWEYDGAARTWDNVTYTEEYSNNPMLCLKDLLVNKIYGLGEYTNTGDFSNTNIIAIIKECHKEYTPTENDYLRWWDAGNTTEFVKSIEDGLAIEWDNTLTINSTSQTVTYAGGYAHWLPVRLDAPLKGGQRYRFSITLSGTDSNVDIDLAVKRGLWERTSNTTWYQLGDYTAPEISDVGDGTHTYDFTAPFTGIIGLLINIKKTGEARNITGIVTDVSLDSIQGSGSNRAWHYHTFNGVFDNQQAALTTLLEFAQAFRVWPSWYEGTFQFVMDKDETPIHSIALSNTKSFSQAWTPLSEIPYRIIGQYTDEDQKYNLSQLMVKSNDTNVPKSNKQTVGLKGITNRKRAERELKFKLTKFTNSTHSINIRCGMDMIHATAGDIINVSNDLPQWGHGSRVASYDAGNQYLYLTEPFTITDATPSAILVKYQDATNSFQTASIDVTGITDGDVVRRITLQSWPANPNVGGPAMMGVSTSYVKKFRLLSVTRTSEEEIDANAIEHLDTIYGSEPTLVVNQDFETRALDAAIGRPGIPTNVVITQLLPSEGVGWDISAEHADMRSQEIVVELGEGLNANDFTQIGVILQGQRSMRYKSIELNMDQFYTFRLYAKSPYGVSGNVYETVRLQKLTFDMEPPTGLQIKGSDALSQTWDGLDVTIQWNPVGQTYYQSGMMDFYTVYLYHTSYDPSNPNTNLLRTAYPKKTEYRYTYDMNVEDNGADNVKGTLIFVVTANLINGVESPRSRAFRVANAVPNTPQNFTSNVSLRTVNFNWQPNTDTDFKAFRYRHQLRDTIGSVVGSWASWEDTKTNSYSRIVNGTEIGIYGNRTQVFFEVKTVDIYNGSSAIASGNNTTEALGVALGTQTVASWMLKDDAVTTAKIIANSVSAAKINVATLSAITANMGVLTAGQAKSIDGRLLIDFDNKFIKIFDAASTLRVQIGSIA